MPPTKRRRHRQRFHHTAWEQHEKLEDAEYATLQALVRIAEHALAGQILDAAFDPVVTAYLLVSDHAYEGATLPRTGNVEDAIPRVAANVNSFSDRDFHLFFRFRRENFLPLLSELNLMEHGLPISIKLPDRSRVDADLAMMMLLRRLASSGTVHDHAKLLGVSDARFSAAVTYLMDYLYDNWASRLSDLFTWEDEFEDFAAVLTAKGCCHDNIIAFCDGKFQITARPGGWNRNENAHLNQKEVYSGYYKHHGLKFISMVLPNGVHLLHLVSG